MSKDIIILLFEVLVHYVNNLELLCLLLIYFDACFCTIF